MLRLAAYDTAHSRAEGCLIGTDWPSVAIVQPGRPSRVPLVIWSILVTVSPSPANVVSLSKNVGSTYVSPGSSAGRMRTSLAFIVVFRGSALARDYEPKAASAAAPFRHNRRAGYGTRGLAVGGARLAGHPRLHPNRRERAS